MTTDSTDAPYGELTIANIIQAPWYIITFDAEGRCTSPQARTDLIKAVRDGAFDHVIVFSHGWNNVWDEVEDLNRKLIAALSSVWDARHWVRSPRVLVVSIFWPSVAVVAEVERGPDIAGDDTDQHALDALAAALLPTQAARLRDLVARGELAPAEAAEFASLLAPLLSGDDEIDALPPSTTDLITMARSIDQASPDPTGVIIDPSDDVWADITAGPVSAGTLNPLSWRYLIRVGSVYAMKRRAGVVGTRGVSPLLLDLLNIAGRTALHLGGHSYGCRVMLSAVCAQPSEYTVASLLLLQPAVSCYCFAEQVPTTGQPGGYRTALDRVRQPIMLTFSEHDSALHKLFGLAMALARDIGEPEIAGPFNTMYAALGGYGPMGVEFAKFPIKVPEDPYPLQGRERILAIDGSVRPGNDVNPAICHHGDVTNNYTGWMLYTQLHSVSEIAI